MAGARVPEAVSFGDEGVAIVALLARDLQGTRAWVSEVLGRLAVDDENNAALRETMRVFLPTGDNYSRTAELLILHRNTVKYRVTKVLGELGGTIDAHRLDVAGRDRRRNPGPGRWWPRPLHLRRWVVPPGSVLGRRARS
jgi:sugar diacid utilization regulator